MSDDASVNTIQTLGSASVVSHVAFEAPSNITALQSLWQRVEELEQLRERLDLGGSEPIEAGLVSDGAFVGKTCTQDAEIHSAGGRNRFWLSFCRCICLHGIFGWSWLQRP